VLLIKLLNKALLAWFRLHAYIKEIMMTIDLKEVGSGFKRTSLNENFIDIEDAINNDLLWRDGSQPMAGSLDMNSERIINLPDADTDQEPVTLGQLRAATLDLDKAKRYEVKLGSQAVGGVFTLNEMSYTPNTNNLEVIRNGQTLIRGVHYTEVDSNTVNVSTTVLATDHFVFKSDEDVALNTTTTASVSHVDNGVEVNLNDFLQDVSSGSSGQGVVDSFALAVASTSGGEVTTTKGYYASTPGVGSATYIKTTETGTIGETDGGSYYYGPDGFKWILLHGGSVNYDQFGADRTATTDSFMAMYNCHQFANTHKLTVRQNSGRFYPAAQVNEPKSISVKTNWDMAGATIELKQGSTYLGSDYIYLFEVESYTTPYTLTQAELDHMNASWPTDFAKGHIRLRNPLFESYKGAGVKLIGSADILRSGGQELVKGEFGQLGKHGMLLSPLTKDYTDGVVSCTLYPQDETRLIINSPHWFLNGVEDVRAFIIRGRHNVTVKDAVVSEIDPQPAATLNRTFFAAVNSYDIEWNNIQGEAWTQTNPPEGMYLFGGNFGYNWRYINCTSTHGWGAVGLNYINRITFSQCHLNRYDVHWAGYNINIDNCVIPGRGIIASGGGQLNITNCRYVMTVYGNIPGNEPRYVVFETRIDYGSEWDGDILVDGLSVEISDDIGSQSRDFSVVTFPYTVTPFDHGRTTILGRNITVRNVSIRHEDPAKFLSIGRPWVMVDYEFGYRVDQTCQIAEKITVDNCNIELSDSDHFIMAYRPPMHYKDTNVAAKPAGLVAEGEFNQIVNISNINNFIGTNYEYSTSAPNSEIIKFGGDLSDMDAGWATRTTSLRPLVKIDRCTGVVAHMAVNGNFYFTNSEIIGLRDFATEYAADTHVHINNCSIRLLDDELAGVAQANYWIPLKMNVDNSLFYPAYTTSGGIHELDFEKFSAQPEYTPVTGTGNRKGPYFISSAMPAAFFADVSDVRTITASSHTVYQNDEGRTLVFTNPNASTITISSGLPIGFSFKMAKPTVSGSLTGSLSGGETRVGAVFGISATPTELDYQMKTVTKITATQWFVSESV
jgi:hypothetical protein